MRTSCTGAWAGPRLATTGNESYDAAATPLKWSNLIDYERMYGRIAEEYVEAEIPAADAYVKLASNVWYAIAPRNYDSTPCTDDVAIAYAVAPYAVYYRGILQASRWVAAHPPSVPEELPCNAIGSAV